MAAGVFADHELADCRPALLRYARLHLRDSSAAEDAVQDTLVAALQAAATFRRESSLQTWLISILRRKLIDQLRRRRREIPGSEVGLNADDAADSGLLERLFEQNGHWAVQPQAWQRPDAALEQAGFFAALETCVQSLPELTARVFVLREVDGLAATEICKELRLSASNYWVMMHRARLRLRECLEQRSFATSLRGN